MKYSLLVFEGATVIGEYPFTGMDADYVISNVLSKLKPGLSGVLLGDSGILAHSESLPKENVWYRDSVQHV